MKHDIRKNGLAFTTALTLSMGMAIPAFAQAAPDAAAPVAPPATSPAPSAAPASPPASDSPAAPAPTPRHAANAQAPDGGAADIIVTARRVEERLQDVPISITVFNQQQITNRNVVNSTDLAAYTPSLSANSNFGIENATFAIRGFVQDAGTPPSVGVYFADVVALRGPTQGTQAGDGAGPGSFFDLQNVQVLKGPQGTLQGRNTTGGAVLFVPQKPTSKYEGYIEGSYGNFDMKRIQGMVNIPLSDIARFRISGDHQERDGYLHNTSGVGPRDYNDVNYTAIRASLVVDLTPDLENYTIVSYSRSNTNGSFNKLIACNSAGTNPLDFAAGASNFIGVFSCAQLAKEKAQGAGFYDAEANFSNPESLLTQWQIINTTTWHVSDTVTIKNIASYGQFRDTQSSPLFGTNWNSADLPSIYGSFIFPGTLPQFTEIAPIPGGITSNQSTATEELQIQGSALDDKLTYQGGLYTEFSDPLGLSGNQSYSLALCSNVATLQCSDPIGGDFTNLTGSPTPITVGAVNYTAGRTSYRDLGAYAQSTYKFTDKLSLTGGIRYTSDRQTNVSQRLTYVFPTANNPIKSCTDIDQTFPACSESLKQKSSKPTWLIDLDYKPTENILAYAKYSRGYRAGGVFANAPSDHRTFSPEKVDAYEAGIKTTLRGALHGTFNVDGFYNNFSNQQLQLGFQNNQNYLGTGRPSPASPTTAIINAGKSRIWGIEVESSISPFAGFTLDVGYTYLNATIRKISPFTTIDPLYQAANGNIAPGSPLALSPKNKVAVTSTYVLPLDPGIGRISVSATFVHTDKQLTNYVYATAADVAAYGGNFQYIQKTNLLNLNASWNNVVGLPVDLSAFATNVTNKKYYTYIPGLGGLSGSGAEFAGVGQPRFFGGRVRYHFLRMTCGRPSPHIRCN